MGAINEVGVGRKALEIAVPFIFLENGSAINEVGVGRKALEIAVPFIFLENGNPPPREGPAEALSLGSICTFFFTFRKRSANSTIFAGFDDFHFTRRSSSISMSWPQILSYMLPGL